MHLVSLSGIEVIQHLWVLLSWVSLRLLASIGCTHTWKRPRAQLVAWLLLIISVGLILPPS